ncbi:MFS transporter [Clostridium sp. JN-9]|uniref:MFS transporter n=1 Tax=Clostridium sp. JN-9 TaxID=2507159 RepID=UPI000FFE1F44|nr:MFS transporter [Clostridium sp. JN-9]QAT39717.1 DHA2 family efflux MFS transporter permease subunit [Clostridium sp. JN-9]
MESLILKNRWKILSVVVLGTLMSTLDSSIVNVALPVMSKNLGVGLDSIQWVVTSYLIVISAFIVIFGKIADRIGKSKIFLLGFMIFGTGSLLCALSNSLEFLIFSRIFQAVGASMFMATNQGLIAAVFPPNERGRALGLSGTTVALGTMLGPPIGGFIVEFFNWQSIFLINLPIVIVGLVMGLRLLPKKEVIEKSKGFDIKGSLLFIIFIVSLLWSVLSGEKMGWANYLIISGFIISIISIIIFYFTEKKAENPMLDFSMFDNKLFDISLFCGFISFLAMFSMNIIHPFYLQYIIKASPGMSGLLMIVSPICIGIVAPISGYISDKVGSEIITVFGLAFIALGLVLTAFLNGQSSYGDIIFRVALIGIGSGLFQSPNNSIVMSCVPKNKLGVAGSINALVRNMGMVSGIAFSVVLLYNRMSYKIGYKVTNFVEGQNQAFLYGMKVVYITAAFICAIGVIITVMRMYKRKAKRSEGI